MPAARVIAGYSGTPLAKKLGFKPGCREATLSAPRGFRSLLAPLPQGERFLRNPVAPMDLIVLFCRSSRDLNDGFGKSAKLLAENGMLWIAWPKKSSGVRTDLNENVVRARGLSCGLVDVKVCAIDQTWSGLKFVIRVKDRNRR